MEKNDHIVLADQGQQDTEKAKERPVKSIIWKEAPTEEVEESIRNRSEEFFSDPKVPPEVKVLGVLCEESLVQTAKELESAHFSSALYTKSLYAGKPTIYAMELFSDRLNLAMSPIGDYPNFAIEMISIPLTRLDSLTGGVAKEIAEELPEISGILLSRTVKKEEKNQAKTELLRFLAKKHPDNVGVLNDSIMPSVGIAFTPDGENKTIKLYIHEIPETDAILGTSMEFYNSMRVYQQIEMNLTREEWKGATVEKIEEYLKSLNPKLQKMLMGEWPQHGNKAWQIFHFFKKLGYGGNAQQQKYEMGDYLRPGMVDFEGKIKKRILETITKGITPADAGLTKEAIDQLFRESHDSYPRNKKLPKGFSIYDTITNKTPVMKLNL